MSEQHAIFLEREKRDGGHRRCVTVEPLARPRGGSTKPMLKLQILGPDQSATEFLSQGQFEELVINARRVMGWDTAKQLVMEGHPAVETQDGGAALIAELDGPGATFVRLQSYDETQKHDLFNDLLGSHQLIRGETAISKRILRVTIEAI